MLLLAAKILGAGLATIGLASAGVVISSVFSVESRACAGVLFLLLFFLTIF